MQSKARPGAPHIRYNANNVCVHWSMKGPDGGGGAGAGYGGGGGAGGTGAGGGVRTAPPPQQQDKAPPPPLTLHHPASNHMISAYHATRPPTQPPPGTPAMPGYLQYAPAPTLRPSPRQLTTPRPTATIIPFFEGAVNPICPPFYSSMPINVNVPLMYPGGGTSEGGRAAPPPGSYSWAANPTPQPQVAIMTPPTPQPNPQQQPQPQPTPYPQGQYATFISRVGHYAGGGGGSGSGGGPGVQQAPPTAVLVDQRHMQTPGAQIAAKAKSTRKNRIPIIHPDTGMEVNVEDISIVTGGASGGSGQAMHQDHTGGGGHPHSQLHHATTNQVSSSGNAHIAADFAKQVALAAMNETSRVPREAEDPQVNGPGSGVLGPAPVEEPAPPPVTVTVTSTTVTASKRPPVPTPVVSAQAEGTTYDIQSIRNNSNRVEIRSGESSPARSKVSPVQQSASNSSALLQQQQQQQQHHHEHSPAPLMHPSVVQPVVQTHQVTVQPTVQSHQVVQVQPVPVPMQHHPVVSVQPSPEHHVQPVQPQVLQAQPQPKPLLEQHPRQQRRPREDKKVTPAKSPVQVEEKEEGPVSRTSPGARQVVVPREEEPPVAVAPPPAVAPLPTPKAPSVLPAEKPVPHSHADSKPIHQVEKSQQPPVEKHVHEKPVEKITEKTTPPETVIVEKQSVPEVVKSEMEKTDKMPVQKPVTEKRSSPAPMAVPPQPVAPSKPKTTFAEGFSLEFMKVSAKAAAQQVAAVTASAQTQAAQLLESSDSTDASHSQVKSRTKQKGKHKQREMNQKGVEKEGTDMDAFIDTNNRPSDNNNRVANDLVISRLPTTDPKTNDLATRTTNDNSSNRSSSEIRNTDRPTDRSASNDNSLNISKNNTDITSKTDSREKSPAQAQADATNNNINNQIAQEMEEVEDSGDDMVAAKNHENIKKNIMEDGDLEDGASQVIAASFQPSLKYQYKDDQWSPVNPQGKKVYDRDFLMKLREDPQCSKKPDITTDLEIFVKEGRDSSMVVSGMRRNTSSHGPYSSFSSNNSMRTNSNNGLFPDFIRSSLSQRMPPKRNSQGAGGNRGSGGGQRSLKSVYSLNIRDEYKFSQSENAWKPSKLTRGQEVKTKDERDTEDLYKKVRGILNKLTPQKFDTLVDQFQRLPISNLDRLQGTIRLVFEKAVDEPAFSLSYANLCRVLGKLQVMEESAGAAVSAQQNQDPNAQAKTQTVHFRKILITRCQQEFETNKKLELDFEKRQHDINKTQDNEKRRELQLQFNEEERKIRMRSVGLVTFIGELFKLKMLTANIMHNCIKQLLGKIDEESLECLCKLLTTIGKEFEEQISSIKSAPGGMSEFNEYFQQMKSLSKKHEGSKVSSRVRFMLQDVIELRQNHWVPRRDENKPKTMAQIQEEVERDHEKNAAMLATLPRMGMNIAHDRGSRRGGNTRGGNQSDDGWTSVPTKYSRNTSYVPEASKIQGLRTTANQELDRGARGETVMLGSSMGYSKWGAGAGSSTRAQPPGSGFTDTNSFSALLDTDRKPPQLGSRLTSLKNQMSNDSKEADKKEALITTAAFLRQTSGGDRDTNRDRDNSRGRGVSGGSPSPSLSGPPIRKQPSLTEQPSQRTVDMQRRTQSDTGRGGSTESSRESTPGLMSNLVDKSRVEAPPAALAEPIDEDKLKQSATVIIEEYISNANVQESLECYKEQFLDSGVIFVSTCLNFIADQMKREKRQKTSRLLGELMRHQQFPPSLLVSELQVYFEMIYDLAVDIPHIWQYLGEIYGDILCLGVMDLSHLKEASRSIPDSSSDTNKLESTLREIFKILLLDKLPKSVKQLWDSSNVQIKDFISDKTAADNFLADFPFLEGKEVVASDSKLPYEEVEKKLLAFLKSNENFDEICGWLTVHVGKRAGEPVFIRHLTEAVIKSSVSYDKETKSYKFDKAILNENLKFIKRYVDNNEELELWCLYSVQYVVVNVLESPSGMLVEIFRELYESMVISPEGFNKWRQDEDRCQGWQKKGRGVAVASSKSFFQAMDQEINDEQDDEPS